MAGAVDAAGNVRNALSSAVGRPRPIDAIEFMYMCAGPFKAGMGRSTCRREVDRANPPVENLAKRLRSR